LDEPEPVVGWRLHVGHGRSLSRVSPLRGLHARSNVLADNA
jgi:hypothetical protein